MNVARLVASIGGYFYSTGADVVAVHLYGGSTAQLTVGGVPITLRQETDYPWAGTVRITVDAKEAKNFAIKLRIPSWARSATISVNGASVDAGRRDRGYAEVRREWKPGDRVELDLPMPVERVYANPKVKVDVGRVALKRGPLVYCLEQVDNPGAPIGMLKIPREAKASAAKREDLFGGVVTVVAEGRAAEGAAWDGNLYRNAPPEHQPARLTGVPYYIWSNRGPNRMAVWIPEI